MCVVEILYNGASLPNSLPDDVRLGNWNWPWWEYLYHRNPQNAINRSSSSPLLGEAVLNTHRLKSALWVLSWKRSIQQWPPLGKGGLEIRGGERLWSDQALFQDSMGKRGHHRTLHQTTDKADERQALWWEQHEVTIDNLSHFTIRPNCPTYTQDPQRLHCITAQHSSRTKTVHPMTTSKWGKLQVQ